MNMYPSCELLRRSLGVLVMCLTACVALAYSVSAHAASCVITLPSTVSFGSVTVPRDAPVGTLIGPLRTSTGSWSCPANPGPSQSGFYLEYVPTSTAKSSAVANVWNTGMAGIGIQVTDVSYPNKLLSGTNYPNWDYIVPPATTSWFGYSNNTSGGSLTFTYQLVKTSQVTAGGPLNASLFVVGSSDIATNGSPPSSATISANATIVAPTCTITTPTLINVAMPAVNASVLSPVGTTAGNTTFNIGLSCQAGTNVYVTLTDSTNPGNTTSNLTLASGSTATGVKLRVLKSNGAPVSYGPPSAIAGNQNQWLVGTSAGTTSIPLTAQYISTGTVGPGTVNGIATFTMSYQ